jgi:sialic acid synthase SpsE
MAGERQPMQIGNYGTFISADLETGFPTLPETLAAVDFAAACGVDGVKFQLGSSGTLYQPGAGEIREIPRDWIGPLTERAHARGIQIGWTPLSIGHVGWLYDAPVDFLKVCAPDIGFAALRDAVLELAGPDIPVIASAAAATESEIEAALNWSDILCDCVSCYPAKASDYRPAQWHGWGGVSDHTASPDIGRMALQVAVEYLERHLDPAAFCGYNDPKILQDLTWHRDQLTTTGRPDGRERLHAYRTDREPLRRAPHA